MIHKKILDRAEEDPSLSIQALADDISGASAELIEAVLEEYGDPAVEDPDEAAGDSESTESYAESHHPDVDDATNPTHPDHSDSSASPDGGAESHDTAQTDRSDLHANGGAETSTLGGTATNEGEDGTQRHTEHDDERSHDPARIDGREGSDDQSATHVVDSPATAAGASPEAGSVAVPVVDSTPDTDSSASAAECDGPITQSEQSDSTESRTVDADNDSSNDNERVAPSSLSEFSQQQRRTLTAIRKRPQATQAAIADELGVSRATVSLRAKAIPGLEWSAREQFILDLFDQADPPSEGSQTTVTSTQTSPAAEPTSQDQTAGEQRQKMPSDQGVAEITRRLDTLSTQLSKKGRPDEREHTTPTASLRHHPELLHKVLRCCMDADDFSEEEEQQLVACLVTSGQQ
ncbi:winged helix-turn-helix domain-containing protein [Halobaculum limi]|uniref:winged helix-turn-helix domain-containing protein n=1 Tax=Halobaculum limi TaxID=3031916 RepID=UPI002406FC9F|nr:winged helix-turn-helix domain-containing protein [Halobaculum sp. YSMS11]